MKFNILIFIIIFMANSAFAVSPISEAGGTKVNKGRTAIEARFGYSLDGDVPSQDKRFQSRQHVDYGFNDWYALRVVVAQDKRNGDSFEHDNFTIENRFQLIERRDHGWDGGFRLVYNQKDGDKKPSSVDLRIVAEVPFSNGWELRHNSIIAHDVGAESQDGISFSVRNQLMKEVKITSNYIKKLELGAAFFNNFGRLNDLSGYSDQDHEIRPVAKVSFGNNTFVKIGYGIGISDASPDHTFKLSLGKSF